MTIVPPVPLSVEFSRETYEAASRELFTMLRNLEIRNVALERRNESLALRSSNLEEACADLRSQVRQSIDNFSQLRFVATNLSIRCDRLDLLRIAALNACDSHRDMRCSFCEQSKNHREYFNRQDQQWVRYVCGNPDCIRQRLVQAADQIEPQAIDTADLPTEQRLLPLPHESGSRQRNLL